MRSIASTLTLGLTASIAALLPFHHTLFAQENYEIQIYGSETVAPGATMLELHSNYTFDGSDEVVNGVLPTQSSLHETIEVTRGIAPDFEVGFYLFTSLRSATGWNLVGSHIRPRVQVPADWGLPMGASLSAEFGYQRREYSTDAWTLELRPIIDGKTGDWYFSFNPTLGLSLDGLNKDAGADFSPGVKVSFTASDVLDVGFEYYGSLGPVKGFDASREQEHQIFPAIDLNVSPDWEINFGVGVGLTPATDHLIAKLILGRRFL
jgi:hypothetical protein